MLMADTSAPFIVTLPFWIFLRPERHSSNSLCPLPSTPAIPTISPFLTEKFTSSSFSFPSPKPYRRCSTFSTVFPGFAVFFSSSIFTSWPTMSLEISASEMSFTW